MTLHTICAYKDQAANGAGVSALGRITGHHMIPDHCFYYTSGLRGNSPHAFLCPGISAYTTEDAPVILVSADANGGKSQLHGLIHQAFDPVELQAAKAYGNEWTYAQAKATAIASVALTTPWSTAELTALLDNYYKNVCGIQEDTLLRAGEHGTMTHRPPARTSPRNQGDVVMEGT